MSHIPEKLYTISTGLPKTFVVGSVYCGASGECVEGAKVRLTKKGSKKVITAMTNNYGDFDFDGLGSGETWSLKVEAKGYYQTTIESIHAGKDVYFKEICLQKKVE